MSEHTTQDAVGTDGETGTGTGLRQLEAERFDALAAMGGERGLVESAAPVLVFVVTLVATGNDLIPALVAALAVSACGVLARLVQRQSLTQALGGVVLVLVSAVWAWRSGEASNFYATGLWINAAWLTALVASMVVRWPLVGVLVAVFEGGDQSWRTDPTRRAERRAAVRGTVVLAAMFALRLVVEVPLYLAGSSAVAILGVARIVLGLPLFALTLWLVWLLVRPARRR